VNIQVKVKVKVNGSGGGGGGGGGVQSEACSRSPYHKRRRTLRPVTLKAVADESTSETSDKEKKASSGLVTTQSRKLGGSDVKVAPIGIGAWSWGESLYWNDGWNGEKESLARGAYQTYLDLCDEDPWLDTAEVYGGIGGESERIIGKFLRDSTTLDETGKPLCRPAIATKFAALPWRLSKQSVVDACRSSLARCKTESCELYQLHWPGLWGNEEYLEGLNEVVKQGLVKAVGVSNYNEKRLQKGFDQLKELGVPLASNQVHYNLLYRLPEQNGVLEKCRELGITLVAYSPLAQGILSGKYSESNIPSGARGRIYNESFLRKARPLLDLMKTIGDDHGGKTRSQVALNWLLTNPDVVVIPGAKNKEQVEDLMGALGWELDEGEVTELRKAAKAVPPVQGFPAENF